MNYFEFIEKYKNADPNSLRLASKKKCYDFDVESAITQIECRKKNHAKLREFISHPSFIFPDTLSAEQASHQAVALYHASLATASDSVLDMTAGLGIDSLSFALKNLNVTSIEINPLKAEVLKKNASILNLKTIDVINADSIQFLQASKTHFDIIFVDPSRRQANNQRVYNLHDCSPDILLNQKYLFEKSDRILIKASPLLDLTQTLKDFSFIRSIRAIGVKGECKEMLIEIIPYQNTDKIIIEAVNLDNDGETISLFQDYISRGSESQFPDSNEISFASMIDISGDKYILEPSAMMMKISPWKSICNRYKAKKCGKSANLFLSSELPQDFPGRVTKIQRILKKTDRKTLQGIPAAVISKNYPMSAEEIRKSLKLKEGTDNFIYGSRIDEKPVLILSESISHG